MLANRTVHRCSAGGRLAAAALGVAAAAWALPGCYTRTVDADGIGADALYPERYEPDGPDSPGIVPGPDVGDRTSRRESTRATTPRRVVRPRTAPDADGGEG
jgi:hypothetical protein